MTSSALRAGLYDRVSTEKQKTARQARENRQAAERHGWHIAEVYGEDGGRSASRFARTERKGWAQLRADLLSGLFDVVVLWEPSRGDRKLTGWSAFLDDCRELGVLIHITRDDITYDVRNRTRDWQDLAKEGIDSAAESEKLSGRILSGVADAALAGVPYGPIAYGYRRWYEGSGKARIVHQEPHPEKAPVAREIIERISRGEAVSRIQQDLADRHILSPSGKPRWARMTITRMVLEGVAYIGKRRHNGGPLLDGNWPPLVDADVYWKAVAVLKDPARKTQVWGAGIRPGKAKYLLSYIVACGKCGAPLNTTRSNWPEMYYRCSSGRGGCAYAPVAWLDAVASDAIIRHLAEPGRYDEMTAGDDREAQAARDEAKAERARLTEFEDQAARKIISAESFGRIGGKIEARIVELEARANELSVPPALSGLLAGRRGEDPHNVTAYHRLDILERWEAMPLAAQRSVVSAVAAPKLAPTGRGNEVRNPDRLSMDFRDRA